MRKRALVTLLLLLGALSADFFLSLLLLHPGDGKRCSNPPLELDLPFSLFLETRTRQTGPNDTPRPIGSQWEKEKTLVPDRFVHNPFEAEEMVTHL